MVKYRPRGLAFDRSVGPCRSVMASILFGRIPCPTGRGCGRRAFVLLVKLMEQGCQCLFGFGFAMRDTYLGQPLPHPPHKLHQPTLICMRGIASDASDIRPNVETLAVQLHITAFRAVLLDGMARREPRAW